MRIIRSSLVVVTCSVGLFAAAHADWSGINNNWRPIGGLFPPGAQSQRHDAQRGQP